MMMSGDQPISAEQYQKLKQVVRQIVPQGFLLGAYQLDGGVSADVLLIEIKPSDGKAIHVVARAHGTVDRQRNLDIATDEFRLLQILHAQGLRVPKPLYVAQAGALFEIPAIIIEYIQGDPEFAPANIDNVIRQAAAQLVAIHRIVIDPSDRAFIRTQASRVVALLERAFDDLLARRIQTILRSNWPWVPKNPIVLLHGDYWLGNLLWHEGQLVGVIDWEDAALGDPLADLASSRLEILWAFGRAAMQAFTRTYIASSGFDPAQLAYWDLWAGLRCMGKIETWGLGAAKAQSMREQQRWFLAQALKTIAG